MGIFSMVLSLLSGVALFLFGMSLMGDGLKQVAGNKLEAFLYKMTNTPLKGVALGTGVTSVIQSSSATTVMVIGFVNSGMMKLKQAIGIIMGANIGTSITGWILCLSYIEGSNGIAKILSSATIAAVVAVIGTIMRMICKRTTHKNIGNIMLGFAILMTGMQTMSGAVTPLRESKVFIDMLTMFSNPIAGILVGVAFTAVLQSASATVGVLQALSVTGILTFSSAFPIILGIGVGASCPVLVSAIGANKNGKRTALVYLLNDTFGMLIWSIGFYTINAFVHFDFLDNIMSPVSIALLNTVFRLVTVCILFPFINKLEKLVCWLVKDSAEELEVVAYLLPHRGEDHQKHRLAAVLRMVPVIAQLAEEMGDQPAPGVKEEDPQHRRDGGGHGVRQQHQRLIKAAAAHHIVDQRGEKQRNEQAADGHQGAEFYGGPERVQVVRIVEQRNEVIQADELAGKAKGIDALQRVPQRFARRPDKKDNGDDELRRDQQIRQPARAEHRTG